MKKVTTKNTNFISFLFISFIFFKTKYVTKITKINIGKNHFKIKERSAIQKATVKKAINLIIRQL